MVGSISVSQTPANFFSDSFYLLFSQSGLDPLLPGNSNLITYLSALMSNRIRTEAAFRLDGADTLTERVASGPEIIDTAEFAFFMASAFPGFLLARSNNLALYDQLGSRLYEILGRHPRTPEEGSNYTKMSRWFGHYRRMANDICKGIPYEMEKYGDLIVPKLRLMN